MQQSRDNYNASNLSQEPPHHCIQQEAFDLNLTEFSLPPDEPYPDVDNPNARILLIPQSVGFYQSKYYEGRLNDMERSPSPVESGASNYNHVVDEERKMVVVSPSKINRVRHSRFHEASKNKMPLIPGGIEWQPYATINASPCGDRDGKAFGAMDLGCYTKVITRRFVLPAELLMEQEYEDSSSSSSGEDKYGNPEEEFGGRLYEDEDGNFHQQERDHEESKNNSDIEEEENSIADENLVPDESQTSESPRRISTEQEAPLQLHTLQMTQKLKNFHTIFHDDHQNNKNLFEEGKRNPGQFMFGTQFSAELGDENNHCQTSFSDPSESFCPDQISQSMDQLIELGIDDPKVPVVPQKQDIQSPVKKPQKYAKDFDLIRHMQDLYKANLLVMNKTLQIDRNKSQSQFQKEINQFHNHQWPQLAENRYINNPEKNINCVNEESEVKDLEDISEQMYEQNSGINQFEDEQKAAALIQKQNKRDDYYNSRESMLKQLLIEDGCNQFGGVEDSQQIHSSSSSSQLLSNNDDNAICQFSKFNYQEIVQLTRLNGENANPNKMGSSYPEDLEIPSHHSLRHDVGAYQSGRDDGREDETGGGGPPILINHLMFGQVESEGICNSGLDQFNVDSLM